MKKIAPTPLPDNLSDLILLALRDLKACEKAKDYQINMGTWHRLAFDIDSYGNKENLVCMVCLAGAVMANSLRVSAKKTVFPEHFEDETQRKLEALDFVRTGAISEALRILGVDISSDIELSIPFYDNHPAAFHKKLKDIAHALKVLGF